MGVAELLDNVRQQIQSRGWFAAFNPQAAAAAAATTRTRGRARVGQKGVSQETTEKWLEMGRQGPKRPDLRKVDTSKPSNQFLLETFSPATTNVMGGGSWEGRGWETL